VAKAKRSTVIARAADPARDARPRERDDYFVLVERVIAVGGDSSEIYPANARNG
jgi:hypothetical protein